MQNVREHPGLMRDESSGAIVNGDSRSLMSAQAHLRQNEELNNDISTLKNDIAELKKLFKEMAENNGKY
tara:strand:+ start:235 stop:441 length:207 start_codon:yes stop_codon:yes gene_type:complete